ncbi:hypothetical protein VPNG_04506 [Cytospora leucostoma]|uniref:FAS1 domain-containing protein n=1 Tax=Cytospora leucostoma TaxID=1230097 RepID=A0A423XCB2_9PEZI|nr:hypothetical protein VPNG_04506 [Cytospora leucostoma]
MLTTSPIGAAAGVLLTLYACLGVAESGLLNGLDQVLQARPDLSTFRDLLSRYPHVLLDLPNYAGFTVIAPDNDAFEKYGSWNENDTELVTDTLQYHILQGTVSIRTVEVGIPHFAPTLLVDRASTNITGGQRVIIHNQGNDEIVFTSGADTRSTVIEGDIEFSDGMVHVVDTLLVPPFRLEPSCRDYHPIMRAFLAALYQTDLIDQFANTQDVTIFAPWDAAFQVTSGALTALQPSELRDILTYHIVPGKVLYSTDLKNATTWPTLAHHPGEPTGPPVNVTATFAGNNRYIDSSHILHADILIANGVLHMMQHVLNPARSGARPNPAKYNQVPVFSLVGSTSTGTKVPVPFTEALPSTTADSGGGSGGSSSASATGTFSTVSTSETSAGSTSGTSAVLTEMTSAVPVPTDGTGEVGETGETGVGGSNGATATTITGNKGAGFSANGGGRGAVAPKCTGLAGALGMGVVGAGLLGAAGVL